MSYRIGFRRLFILLAMPGKFDGERVGGINDAVAVIRFTTRLSGVKKPPAPTMAELATLNHAVTNAQKHPRV
jgi:hypothetical protein